MRLLFSEATPDYGAYVFPYVVWAFPDPGEPASEFFARGFLPSPSRDPPRYYLCRSVRVDLRRFAASSENRRVLRKGQGLSVHLASRADFVLSPAWEALCLSYAEARFGVGVMSKARLDRVLEPEVTSHVLVFRDETCGRDVGLVTLLLDPPAFAQYHFAFYALDYQARSLGMLMMTTAVARFREDGLRHLYLGSCYSRSALYKTQFAGVEWFDGSSWSTDLAALKYVIERSSPAAGAPPADPPAAAPPPVTGHLLESEDYLHRFHDGAIGGLLGRTLFTLPI